MKYFKKEFKPNWTVGSHLRGGDVGPITAEDRLMADLYASKRMHREGGIARIFSPLSKKEVDLLAFQKKQTGTINTRLPSHVE